MVCTINRWLLYQVLGWRAEVSVTLPEKYLIALAPHTSNWDFFIGLLYSRAEKMRCQFLMKKYWFFWPLGPILRRLGGIAVDRSGPHHLTDQVADVARRAREFGVCITPEGTRRAVKNWKKGFYYIAEKADLPIYLFGLDFSTKRIVCDRFVKAEGDVETLLQEMKTYFSQFRGKNPEKFAI